jgi:hypothetical protein
MLQAGRSPVRVPDEVDIFKLPKPSSRIMALESTQPLTKMSTRNIPRGKNRPACRADNLAPSVNRLSRENVGASTSRNLKGLHGLYRDIFTFLGVKSGRGLGLTTANTLCRENVGASTSRNPKGLHGLCRDNFTFTFTSCSSYCQLHASPKFL